MAFLTEAKAIVVDVARVAAHEKLRWIVALYALPALAILIYALATLPFMDTLMAMTTGILFLPIVEFIVHKYVLHLLELAKYPPLAEFWNRVHYAHHREPRDYGMIPAHPASMLSLVTVLTGLYAVFGFYSWIPLAATAMLLFAFYEIVHFACHVDTPMTSRYMIERRQAHALHHYVDENRNFGITTAIADRVMGTMIGDKKDLTRSPTARNLGYTGDFAERYPYLKNKHGKD